MINLYAYEEELSLQRDFQTKQYNTSTTVDDSSTMSQDSKTIEGKVGSIFDIEIQSALNQIQSAENTQTGEDSNYDDSKYDDSNYDDSNYDNIFFEGTQEDSDQDVPVEGMRLSRTDKEDEQVDRLKEQVRKSEHEMAHLATAGGLAGPYYEYQQGPDSKQYVVGVLQISIHHLVIARGNDYEGSQNCLCNGSC